jgi:hypothetical protein
MNKTLWTAITAIICVALVSTAIGNGMKSISQAKIEVASSVAEDAMLFGAGGLGGGGLSIGGGLTMDDEGDASADGSADGSTDGSAEGDAAEGEGESGPKKPTSVQGVLDLYNNSINKVISEKAGYAKSRTTTINTLDGGALLKIQLVVDMVHDFLGSGTTDYKNEKGKAEYLSKASLTKDDLNAIDIQEADGLWVITLGLKPGQSQASGAGSSDTTPIQRSGLFVGKGDKKAFDYKSSENIYTAINGVAKAESAKETVTRTNITAKIDPATGNIVELTIDWDWNVQLTNVSYSVATVKSAKGTATSKVVVKDFQW